MLVEQSASAADGEGGALTGAALRGAAVTGAALTGAALLTVVAEESRYALLQALTSGTTCVCELQRQVPIAANLLSYHLKVLREAGLITASRRGRWIDYTLAAGAVDRLHAALPGSAAQAEAGCRAGGDVA